VLLRFFVTRQLLLVSLVLCFVNLFFTLVIAFLKHLFGSSESLAYAPEKMYGHMLKKCDVLFYLCIYLLELCITLCGTFISTKHFIIHFRLTELIKYLQNLRTLN